MPHTDPEKILAALDPEQREVARTVTGPVVVLAGAGTGKTRAITHRIAYGTAIGAYPPNSVLALTFTTRAAGEMRGRLHRLGVEQVQARTFHAAALRQAQYFWPRSRGVQLPPVADNRFGMVAEAANRLRVGNDTARIRDLVQEVGWAKVSNVTPEAYAKRAAEAGRSVNELRPEVVGRVLEAYEDVKIERGVIDFDDILLCTAALLDEDPAVAEEVRSTYRHLTVDEFQDVSPLQQTLLNLWLGDSQELCVVGDPGQTIHSFAGARADHLLALARQHPDRTIRLHRDYRSSPQVVQAANKVLPTRLGGLELTAQQPAGPDPIFVSCSREAEEATQIASWLEQLHEQGTPYSEMAVLFRINAQSPAVEEALGERGIPYQVKGVERFYERGEVRRALGVLNQAVRQDGAVLGLEGTRSALASIGWTPEAPSGQGAVRERWESWNALLSVAEDMEEQQPGVLLSQVVAEFQRRAELMEVPTSDAVTVSTLHQAKGLEWEAVALLGIHEGGVPFVMATADDEIAEERRLLYVGITRAKKNLRISWSAARGRAVRPSRFLAPILPEQFQGGRPSRTAAKPARRGSIAAAKCESCQGSLDTGAERKIGRHFGCVEDLDVALLERLREWRKETAKAASLPAFCIFTDATLVAVAQDRPRDAAGLLRLPGLGRAKVDKYGADMLRLIDSHGTISADS
ncbi:ATP-dependent DNA helicase UvrD2 [Parenemella sanctibonifatiensis]|uniref:DNA 3'-5' helicase n=1 Tax=Parenemella sanctibonifatiensis TaxID=2016505 RepID=A0A255E505_9ACTN|nr:ATP-dependent DNA helicase UvrD2 [Parenemella sanctibonifatiensis]OYN86648.1 ATP-dependent DNA helicase [Parenemella sanctibonifatiensis]